MANIDEIVREGQQLLAEKAAKELLASKEEAQKTEPVAAKEEKAAPVAEASEKPVDPPKKAASASAAEDKATSSPPKADPIKDEAKLDKALDDIEDDDDDPDSELKADDKGNIKLPYKAFKTRITRASKAALKSVFGTDDREQIIKMKEDYEKMLSDRETDRRTKMAAEERAKEDLEKAHKKISDLEARELARQEAADAEREEKRITNIASKYVDAGALDLAHYKFAKHLKKFSKDELNEFDDERIENWYQKWAAKNPKLAASAPKEEKKVPVNVGASQPVKPSPKGSDTQKTAARGYANSMTDEEWKAYKRQHRISY